MMPRVWVLAAGAVLATSLSALAGDYAPLNCSKARFPAETAICKSYALGQAEARMATLYGVVTSLVAMGRRGDIQDQQRAWLTKRDACGDRVGCLEEAYTTRIHELNAIVADVASRGPF